MDYRKVLLAVAPHGKAAILDGFAAAMPECIAYADISTPARLSAFIGQVAHESDGFATTTEYASGKAYEGRRDLGNTQPGDGVRFKGRGLIQITGRANYAAASKEMGVDFIADPVKMAAFPYAAWAADRYWKTRGLNAWADKGDIREITRRVNGGFNGLAQRIAYTRKARDALTNLKGALTAAAGEEQGKAEAKSKTATAAVGIGGSAALAGTAPTAATHAALGAPAEWALIVAGVALAGLAVWLFLSIRKHQDAAAALTEAAKGA